MSRLKLLEVQRLLKELEFVESDYLFQSEILKQSEPQFFESVNFILDDNPDLKTIWEDKSNKLKVTNTKSNIEIDDLSSDTKSVVGQDFKKIYREIVKNTHPDRIKNTKLNDLYIQATTAYEINDIVELLKVSNNLMIEVDWSDEILLKVRERIQILKKQIIFLESTFTFKWLKCSDEKQKNKILIDFIENIIK
jgi:hypothetical protein